VVQLYLQDLESTEKIPQKQLKAFSRISLKKAESQMVTFQLNKNDLASCNSQNEFKIDPGVFNLQIGASSDDIRQEISFKVIE
jgi:beta-glucosidase